MKKNIILSKVFASVLIFLPTLARAGQECPKKDHDRKTETPEITGFKSVFGPECVYGYEGWMGEVWGWALMVMIPLSVLILAAAGVLYMVSEGDSNRIGLAKKLIIGVASGVGLLVLARLLLNIIGVEGVF